MNWENIDNDFEEDRSNSQGNPMGQEKDLVKEHNQSKIQLQLQKYKDPTKNIDRQAYISLATTFGDLLIQNKFQEIAQTLVTEDCKFFLFWDGLKNFCQYSDGPEEFIHLFKIVYITERKVQETYVDLERKTVCQISYCTIIIDNQSKYEICFELFSIEDNKISKYRGFFGHASLEEENKNPLGFTRKEKMLYKIKQINYALTGEPDLQKVASMLHESTEYKIWSWENQKCVVLRKHDFESDFKNLQQNFVIRQIVPFELFTDVNTQKDVVISTYTYHLEPKNTSLSHKFIWLSTCIYAFDQDINIVKVSQQGELFPENDISIPFDVCYRESMVEKVHNFYKSLISGFDIFYNDIIQPDFQIYRVGPHGPGQMGGISGFNHLAQLLGNRRGQIDWIQPVDTYIDQEGPGLETAIIITCGEGRSFLQEEYFPSKETINMLSAVRIWFEKGKFMRTLQVFGAVIEPIPSPFDDVNFSFCKIKR